MVPNHRTKSAVNSDYLVSTQTWVVSIVNIPSPENVVKQICGHSVIVVEGLQTNIDSLYVEPFIGQYDILATASEDSVSLNMFGEIEQVRVFESQKAERNYSQYHSVSFYANPKLVKQMIAAVKKDKYDVEEQGHKIPFELVKWTQNNETYNCTSWCYEKLNIIGVNFVGKPKPIKPIFLSCSIT
ncbi:MAG: hypothetical protein Tsb005_07020 [Gammaproteobacteria bacterium]